METKRYNYKGLNNYNKLYISVRNMRSSQTEAEEKMRSVLRRKQVKELKFLRQKIVGQFILDFYCHEIMLGIEIGGGVHFENNNQYRDVERFEIIKNNFNIKIIRYTNDFILKSDFDTIRNRVLKDIKA